MKDSRIILAVILARSRTTSGRESLRVCLDGVGLQEDPILSIWVMGCLQVEKVCVCVCIYCSWLWVLCDYVHQVLAAWPFPQWWTVPWKCEPSRARVNVISPSSAKLSFTQDTAVGMELGQALTGWRTWLPITNSSMVKWGDQGAPEMDSWESPLYICHGEL